MIYTILGFKSLTEFQQVPPNGEILTKEGEEFSVMVVTPWTLEQYEVTWNTTSDPEEKTKKQDSYVQLNSTFVGTKSKTDMYLMAQVLQLGEVQETFNFVIKRKGMSHDQMLKILIFFKNYCYICAL